MARTLKSHLSLAVAVLMLLTVGLISLLSNILISRQFHAYVAETQKMRTAEIVRTLSQPGVLNNGSWNEALIHNIGMHALYDGFIIKVYDNAGLLVWDAENHDMALCNEVMAVIARRMHEGYPHFAGELVSEAYPLNLSSGSGRVQITYYGPYFLNENDFQFLKALNRILIGTGFAALILAVFAGRLLAVRLSRPLHQAAAALAPLAVGDYALETLPATGISELDALTKSLRELTASLKEQKNLRKQLTADVAHELRTPLTSVSAFLEAMQEGVWEPTPERLAACREEINRLTTLIKDLEKLADLDNAVYTLELAEFDLLLLAQKVAEEFEALALNAGVSLTVTGRPVTVRADARRVGQVLVNLIGNALKYTLPGGHICVTLEEFDHEVQLAVTDDGCGIAAEDLPFIFERFFRADKSRSRATGGAGIGLAIVRAIVAAHSWQITVDSAPGKGAQFRLHIPC